LPRAACIRRSLSCSVTTVVCTEKNSCRKLSHPPCTSAGTTDYQRVAVLLLITAFARVQGNTFWGWLHFGREFFKDDNVEVLDGPIGTFQQKYHLSPCPWDPVPHLRNLNDNFNAFGLRQFHVAIFWRISFRANLISTASKLSTVLWTLFEF
jgi:hypothetical protein